MGSWVPPPVWASPAAAVSSARVVVATMVTGSPLCWPRVPDVSIDRHTVCSASWVRWAGLRVSASIWFCEGVPSRHGVWSSGLP